MKKMNFLMVFKREKAYLGNFEKNKNINLKICLKQTNG